MKTTRFAPLLALLLLPACHDRHTADERTFTDGMKDYLARRGDLCVGKTTWPIDVTRAEAASGARDALQMPVLERLGLVYGADAIVEFDTEDGHVKRDVRRYELTSAGQRYYIARGVNGAKKRDLCVAKLSLDHVVGWDPPTSNATGAHTVVKYMYQVEAAPWTGDPGVVRTFPMVDRVLRGAGTDRLDEAFTLTKSGWIAEELLDEQSRSAELARAEVRRR